MFAIVLIILLHSRQTRVTCSFLSLAKTQFTSWSIVLSHPPKSPACTIVHSRGGSEQFLPMAIYSAGTAFHGAGLDDAGRKSR